MPPDVPKTATGEVDMNAPVPRTADGHPDLSGLWRGSPFAGPAGGRRGGGPRGGGPGAGGPPTPTPPPPANTPASSEPPAANFLDIGQNMPGGLPFTPWAQALLKERVAGNSKDNPEAHCLPLGIIQLHTQGDPRRFLQTPRELVILYEASSNHREIFTDGRSLLKQGDPQPFWNGYSVGHWEGDTLVVESNNFRDLGWLDVKGSPLTDQAVVTERFHRLSYGRMDIDITINDPKAYTRPWTVRTAQTLMPDQDIIEFICLENQHFK
jgi:hypothetical protein